jgi:hypothetical protein
MPTFAFATGIENSYPTIECTALREKNGRVNECGLFGLDRKIRPVGEEYKRLIALWRDTLPTERYSIRADY